MLRRSLGTLALASIALACDSAPTPPRPALGSAAPGEGAAAAAAAGPRITGGGTITFGASHEQLAVNVIGLTGRAVFHDKTPAVNVSGEIEINCVRIVGNQATLSGIVTRSNSPEAVPEGWEAVFQIQDNGEGRGSTPDMMSPIVFHAVGIGPNCLVPLEDFVPVNGDFQIRP